MLIYSQLQLFHLLTLIFYDLTLTNNMDRYEINLANRVLFDNLHLVGMQELLPGRLFSTRMPRNIKKDPVCTFMYFLNVYVYTLMVASRYLKAIFVSRILVLFHRYLRT